MTTYTAICPLTILADIIRQHGPIPTVRVSSAQARGRAKRYSYWGAVRYEIRLTCTGQPANMALERASSDRRSVRGAERDAAAIAEAERRIECSWIYTLSDTGAAEILASLARGATSAAHRDSAAAALAAAMAEVRSIPHWLERAGAGALVVHPYWLTAPERAALRGEEGRIRVIRQKRAEWRAPRRHHPRLVRYTWRGIPLEAIIDRSARRGQRVRWGRDRTCSSRREAAREILHERIWSYRGGYVLRRSYCGWDLIMGRASVRSWERRPSRRGIAAAIRAHRAAQPSRRHPDTLGWRAWAWSEAGQCLVSPHRGDLWRSPELIVKEWSTDLAVRGEAGVHAMRLPCNWRRAMWASSEWGKKHPLGEKFIVGVVERFGRFVLGRDGWRAEHAIIRELLAPNVETMVALIAAYPEVRVHLKEGI